MVLDREIPWRQHSHRADDIATAMRIADEFGYQLVIDHGTEAHLIADLIAEKGIPVIIGPLIVSRSKVEVRNRSTVNPGLLAGAGVEIAITTDHPVCPIDYLVHQATLAVKDGLDRDTALRAITINPARMLGLDDRIGSLEAGKLADLAIWSGDPLDVMQRALQVFIEGQQVYAWSAPEADDAGGQPPEQRRRVAERAALVDREAAERIDDDVGPTLGRPEHQRASRSGRRHEHHTVAVGMRLADGESGSRERVDEARHGRAGDALDAGQPAERHRSPEDSTERALSRARVSPASASTRPIARSRWMAPELRSRAVARSLLARRHPITLAFLSLLGLLPEGAAVDVFQVAQRAVDLDRAREFYSWLLEAEPTGHSTHPACSSSRSAPRACCSTGGRRPRWSTCAWTTYGARSSAASSAASRSCRSRT